MSAFETAHLRNGILRALPRRDIDGLRPFFRRERLAIGQVIEPRNAAIESVYFLENGVASVVAISSKGKKMETGPFGREGMSGLPVVHYVGQSPTETIVQVEGDALTLPAGEIEKLMQRSDAARSIFLRYSYAFSLQAIQTALSAGLSSVPQRLTRWILMLHDRLDGDEIDVTHDFVAMMLGVRRPGVTVALHVLEGHHLLKSERGKIIVRDRAGLEAFCGDIYGLPEREYRRVISDWKDEDEPA